MNWRPIISGGSSYVLLHNFFAAVASDLLEAPLPVDLYERMTRLAAQAPPDAGGLRCEPLFTGSRTDPQRRGAIAGVSATNFTPANLSCALLQGVIEQLHQDYRKMLDAGVPRREEIVGAGNALRKNRVLRDAAAQAFGAALHAPLQQEEAALGAALLVAVSAGSFRNFADAAALVQYEPDKG